jgi:predicted 3-demethylubiquinone-9 3-methyltransferase (glyoxalase superfamily)
MTPQKIKPFLWYNHAAEQAAEFYGSLLPNSHVSKITRYPEGVMAPAGTVMTVEFTLSGVEFVATFLASCSDDSGPNLDTGHSNSQAKDFESNT